MIGADAEDASAKSLTEGCTQADDGERLICIPFCQRSASAWYFRAELFSDVP